MDSTLQVSEYMIQRIKDGDNANHVARIVEWYLNDLFNLLENINNTSLNESDRKNRILELQSKYGIPVKHLLNQ